MEQNVNSRQIRLSLIIGILCMTGITAHTIWERLNEPRPIAQIPQEFIRPKEEFIEPSKSEILIKEFNQINSQISSFDSSDIFVKVWENGMRFRISGAMHYEKPKRFRFKIWTPMGLEMDFGSNDQLFWYWSRRDIHPGLYYASYEDYHKTCLKTPFNPVFLRESLGLDEIDVSNAGITENDKYVIPTWQKINAMNEKVLYSMFLNKTTKRMDGIVISNLSGKILASCEITYEGLLPKRILYDWQEEQKSLTIEFNQVFTNRSAPSSLWELPQYYPKFDMGK